MISGKGGSSTIAMAMISLVAGLFLLMKTCKEEMCCKLFYKIMSWAVIVISILMILGGGYWKIVKCSEYGWCPKKMMMKGDMGMMHHKGMMQGMEMRKIMKPGMMQEEEGE